MSKERIQHLRKVIDRADVAYYNKTGGILSDDQYDALKAELLKLAPGDERIIRVGPPELSQMLEKIEHGTFMGSLNKCDTPDELKKWYADMMKGLARITAIVGDMKRRGKIVATLKADGGSVALYYKDGVLWKAVTRGGDDGIGEDITSNMIHAVGVPTQLHTEANIAVRGEVILPVDEWKKIDTTQHSNPRNIGNGIMRRMDGTNSDKLKFIAFDMDAMLNTFPDEIATEKQKLEHLATAGFEAIEHAVFDTVDEAIAWYDDVAKRRDTLPFQIDGVVFKMNDLVLQRELGIHDNRPRAQTVLKFGAEGAETTLNSVVLTMGHTGAIIPTGKLAPVRIGGTTVSSVLLNNFDFITDLDLAVGDKVFVSRRNDVIPYVERVLDRPASRQPIQIPTTCPACGGPVARRVLVKSGEGRVLECKNKKCDSLAVARIKSWIKKLDILDIGDSVLESLVEEFTLESPAGLYRLAEQPGIIAGLAMGNGRVGASRAQKICENIKAKKVMTLNQFMGSLGIPHLGRRRVQLIREAVPGQLDSVQDWISGKLLDLAAQASIPNIADEIMEGIEAFVPVIADLLTVVTIKEEEKKMPKSEHETAGVFANTVVCFTGAIERTDENGKRFTRKRLQELVLQAGGSVSDDVKAGTTHLVQADPSSTSSKSTKAKSLGVKMMSEAEFFQVLGM